MSVDCAKRLKEPFHSAAHGDLFYDEKGLLRLIILDWRSS